MIDAIVKRTVRYRQHSFIRVVRRTLAVIFPLALIGIIAQVLFIVFFVIILSDYDFFGNS